MKRFFILAAALILMISVFLSGCSFSEVNRDKELETSFETTSEELSSTFSESNGKYSLVAEYLNSWAKKNAITVTEKNEHYMVLTNSATSGYEDKESTVLQCSIKTDDFNNSMQPLAVSLTSLLGPVTHGKISLIVTEDNDGQLVGAAAASPKYYQGDNVICMENSKDTEIITSGSSTLTSTMASDISTTSPSYSTAFAITMTMSSYADPFEFESRYPNPIEVIGSLLAAEKSTGKLFELSSFNCESADGYMPISATAIVVVDQNNIESFTKKFDSSYEDVKKKFDTLEDNFVYTLTETTMPSTVMTSQTSDNIISLMYTLQTGAYSVDEESGITVSASDTSFISTEGGKFKMVMESRSLENNRGLKEMSKSFELTSGLCDIQYSASEPHMTWASDENKPMTKFFITALGSDDVEPVSTMRSTTCDIFASKADNLNMIIYMCTADHGKSAVKNITHFLESLVV